MVSKRGNPGVVNPFKKQKKCCLMIKTKQNFLKFVLKNVAFTVGDSIKDKKKAKVKGAYCMFGCGKSYLRWIFQVDHSQIVNALTRCGLSADATSLTEYGRQWVELWG
jgi:hypothetical protein